MFAALSGFQALQEKVGYFDIQEHMICINKQAKVKVWINENLSKRFPDTIYTEADGTEQMMAKRII